MPYRSTKTWGHDLGLSCSFRQWRAESHCRFIHGYALAIRLEFEADALDERNWVIDFGSLGEIKRHLTVLFDHTLLVAADDPMLMELKALGSIGVAQVRVIPNIGCEAFAELIYGSVDLWLELQDHKPRVRLGSVEVKEHGANSAIFTGRDGP